MVPKSNEGMEKFVLHQMLKVYDAVQEQNDLLDPPHDALLVFGLNVARWLQRRDVGAGKLSAKSLPQPVDLFALPDDGSLREVGHESDFEFIFGADAEQEPSSFLNVPALVVDFRLGVEFEERGDLLALLLGVDFVVPQVPALVEHLLFFLESVQDLACDQLFGSSECLHLLFLPIDLCFQGLLEIGNNVLELGERPVFEVDLFACMRMTIPSSFTVPI